MRQNLDLGKIVVLGGSYGGFLALEYALAHPENLHAVILRDTAASNRFQDTSKERAMASDFPMDEATLDRLFSGQIESNEDFRESFRHDSAALHRGARSGRRGRSGSPRFPFVTKRTTGPSSRNQPGYDLVDRLPEIQVPVLITVGRHDWITPLEASQELAAGLPNSELVIFEHSGHSPQLEETAALSADRAGFSGRPPAGGGSP